jgi:hypothetical protein
MSKPMNHFQHIPTPQYQQNPSTQLHGQYALSSFAPSNMFPPAEPKRQRQTNSVSSEDSLPTRQTNVRAPKFERTYTDALEDELFDESSSNASQSVNSQNQLSRHATPNFNYQRMPQYSNQVYMDKNARATSSPAAPQQTPRTTTNQQMATMMYPSNQPNTNFYHPLAHQQNQQQLSSSAVADSVRRLQVPNRTTVSPREAFLDYPDSADFREKTLFSTSGSPYSQTQEGQDVSQQQESESSESNDEYNVSDALQENQIPISAVAAFPATELHANTASMSVPVSSRSTSASTPFSGAPSGDMSESDVSSDSEYDPSTTSARRTSRSSGRSGQLAKSFACADCGKRFEKSQPLQVHRRNSHGKGSGPPSLNQAKFSNTSHRCDWIDPSTGKMCNTVFSRP